MTDRGEDTVIDLRLVPPHHVAPFAKDAREIIERGNDDHVLRLLLAQRRLYKAAKRNTIVRLAGVGLLAFVAPIVSTLLPNTAAWWGAAAGLWAVCTRTLRVVERQKIERAAHVQDEIDRTVFGLEPNRSIGWLHATDVAQLTEGDLSAQVKEEKLHNWYDTIPEDIVGPAAVSAAQFSNISYSRRLQERQLRLLIRVAVALGAINIVVPLVASRYFGQHVTVLTWLVGAAMPALPAVIEIIDAWVAHGEAIRRLCRQETATTKVDTGLVSTRALNICQDEMFDDRRRRPLVFEALYWRGRQRDSAATLTAVRMMFARNNTS